MFLSFSFLFLGLFGRIHDGRSSRRRLRIFRTARAAGDKRPLVEWNGFLVSVVVIVIDYCTIAVGHRALSLLVFILLAHNGNDDETTHEHS